MLLIAVMPCAHCLEQSGAQYFLLPAPFSHIQTMHIHRAVLTIMLTLQIALWSAVWSAQSCELMQPVMLACPAGFVIKTAHIPPAQDDAGAPGMERLVPWTGRSGI